MWKIENIPEEVRPEILKFYKLSEFSDIADIFVKYDVIPGGMCRSCGFKRTLKAWVEYAINIWGLDG